MTNRESDPPIVLSDGSAGHTGKGRTVGRSLQRTLVPDSRAGAHKPTSLQGIARSGVTRIAAASLTEEPGAGKPHAGICAGGVG
jgi:hypothetical protein